MDIRGTFGEKKTSQLEDSITIDARGEGEKRQARGDMKKEGLDRNE